MLLQYFVPLLLFIHDAYSLPDDSPFEFDCVFTHGSHLYDLCPLLRPYGPNVPFELLRVEETPPTIMTHSYQFALFEGGLKKDGEANDQCPSGTWVCKTVTYTMGSDPSHSSGTLQVIPVVTQESLNITGNFYRATDLTKNPISEKLIIYFRSQNSYVGQRQWLQLEFECDNEAQEPSLPQYKWDAYKLGAHDFLWKSKHACPQELPPGSPPSTGHPGRPIEELPDGEPETIPPILVTPNPGEKYVLQPVRRRWSYGMVTLSIGFIVLAVFLAYRLIPQIQLLSKFAFSSLPFVYAGRGRFRPAPRWARNEPGYDYEELDAANDYPPRSTPYEDAAGDQETAEFESPTSPSSPGGPFSSGKGNGVGSREYTTYGSFGN